MKQEGFYVTKRCMSAPVKKRTKSTFGSAAPIEKPTMGELDYYTEGYSRHPLTASSCWCKHSNAAVWPQGMHACTMQTLNQLVGLSCCDNASCRSSCQIIASDLGQVSIAVCLQEVQFIAAIKQDLTASTPCNILCLSQYTCHVTRHKLEQQWLHVTKSQS